MKTTRVLIVDDEPGIRESLTGVLEDEGYFCAPSKAAKNAWKNWRAQSYEVVLLDVWLQGMDGLETLARIQEIPFADRPEVVIISGHGTIETAVKATKLGAFDFLEKPLTIDKVTRGAQERGAAAAAGAGAEPAEGIGRRQAAHHRRERADESAAPAIGPDGRHQWPRADFRRKRHRQGTDRARDSRRQRARRGSALSK